MFEGEIFKNAVKVPREALRSGDVVWVLDSTDNLVVRKVHVERSERDYVVVTDGLNDGERVITSPIELPVNGMKVEPVVKQKNELN
jgi:multidrug efflux pump subunit AcrA (membrane-fusion protein)